jgi:predicted dehydrogenase
MNIAIVGCGYVAEFYGKTLGNYPELKLIGAYDQNDENLTIFCRRWRTRRYNSLDEVLNDSSIEMVLNLTNPRSHYDVTKQCLESGKHVYSEKPLAMQSGKVFIYLALLAACSATPRRRFGKRSPMESSESRVWSTLTSTTA